MPIFRLDRFLTLYFFYPLTRILPQRKEPTIPILMYHSISESNEKRMHPYYETCTSPEVFAEHMKFLYENKYKIINLDQAVKILKSPDTNLSDSLTNKPLAREIHVNGQRSGFHWANKPDKQKFVVLTFDDGFRDFYTEAFPVLQNYGFSAAVFLPTAFIGNRRLKFKGKECLSWQEVRDLHNKGITFGSHTINHLELNTLQSADIEFELKRSKEQIEDEIKQPIECFSYPFAFPEVDKEFIKWLRGMLENLDYKYGVSTRLGTATSEDDRHFLKRIIVNNFDDTSLLKAKLNGGYDWLHKLQYFSKSIKHPTKS